VRGEAKDRRIIRSLARMLTSFPSLITLYPLPLTSVFASSTFLDSFFA
jgi:hypothetical protein